MNVIACKREDCDWLRARSRDFPAHPLPILVTLVIRHWWRCDDVNEVGKLGQRVKSGLT
jgi:hypothetical protein